MYYTVLILLFIAIFAFLFWLIIKGRRPQKSERPDDAYVCPVCNETECLCHKVEDDE